jgi:hypothetical protein
VVTPTTIEVTGLGRRRGSYDLASCGEFEVWRNPFSLRQYLVVFDYPEDDAKRLATMSRGLSGHSSALPDSYGMKAAELADILNGARATAERGSGNLAT